MNNKYVANNTLYLTKYRVSYGMLEKDLLKKVALFNNRLAN